VEHRCGVKERLCGASEADVEKRKGYVEHRCRVQERLCGIQGNEKQVWNEADVMCRTRGIEKQDIKLKKWKRKTTQRFMGCSIFLFFLAHITV
jgi:hypothetical protein